MWAWRFSLNSSFTIPPEVTLKRPNAIVTSLATSGALQSLNVATGILLARELGPADRGDLAAVLLWPGLIAAVAGLGIGHASTYYVARAHVPPATVLSTSLALAAALSVGGVVIGVILMPVILSGYEESTLRAAYLYLAFIPLNIAALYIMGTLNGLNRYVAFQALRVLVIAVSGVVIVALAILDNLTVDSAVLAYLGANLVTMLAALWATRAEWDGPPRLDLGLARSLVGFGVKSQTTTMSAFLNQRLDLLAISVVLSPAQLAIYTVAVTVSSVTNLIGSSVALVALPSVARAKGEDTAREVTTYASLTLVCSILVSLPILLLVPFLIPFLFGSEFAPAVDVARVLLVGAVAYSTSRTLEACLQGLGRPLEAGLAEGGALLFTAVGLATLLPLIELQGAALASLVAYTASVLLMTRRVSRHLEVSWTQLYLPSATMLQRLLTDLRSRSPR